mgnify:CR=1 FL=1
MAVMAKTTEMFTFEVYCLDDKINAEQWQTLHKAFITHLGVLKGKYTIIFASQENIIRFFVRTNRDISGLSNSIDGFLLRPVADEAIGLPENARKELGLFSFVNGGNILDLREKQTIKRGRTLQFASISVQSLTYENAIVSCDLYFELPGRQWTVAHKMMTSFPAQLLAIDFTKNTIYLKKTVPKYLNIEKSMPILSSENINALLEIDTFPYLPKNYFLNLSSYEFDKHSLIIGASGSGKSKFISLLVDRLQRNMAVSMNYRVIVIDPHAAIADDFNHIENKKVINFGSESTELFSGSATDISAATELTGTLFRSLIGENATPKTDRLLRFSLYVLLTAQSMSLGNLKRFLTEIELRQQVLDHVKGFVPDNIIHFFGSDFNELRTKYYNESISPIVSLVDEMQMQPALVGEGELSLANAIENNFLTVFSLNKLSMGEKVVKTVAGLLIQQIFLLAQSRVFGQRLLLIIDEVSVVQNPALAQILSEARKFNLTVILTQQYFGQIEKDIQDAIFSNVYNYYAFKVSEEDARALEGNLTIELPKELVESENAKGIKEQEIRVKIMTELHPRECIVRVLAKGQVVPAFKARTLDAPTASRASTSHDQKLKTYKPAHLPTKFDEKNARQAHRDITETPSVDVETEASEKVSDQPSHTPPNEKQLESSKTHAAHDASHDESTPSRLGAFAAKHYVPTGAAPGETYRAATSMQSLTPQTFNLSDLLAEHSSSRFKVNNKKDT